MTLLFQKVLTQPDEVTDNFTVGLRNFPESHLSEQQTAQLILIKFPLLGPPVLNYFYQKLSLIYVLALNNLPYTRP